MKEGDMATTGPALSTREQIVTIYLDANGNLLRVDPDTFQVSKSAQEEVVWQTNPRNRPFSITFDNESPFHDGNFSHVNCYSGLVRREINGGDGKRYKYTVSVGAGAIDPDGIVNA
jgi:hypothetical protein